MKSDIQIRNSADVCYIDIEGTIGVPEQWQFAAQFFQKSFFVPHGQSSQSRSNVQCATPSRGS